MLNKARVAELIKEFQLEVLCGGNGLKRNITVADLHRPGLELAGFVDFHPQERIHILGRTELSFCESLTSGQRRERLRTICHEQTPCIVVSRNLEIPSELMDEAEAANIPVLRSGMPTTVLASRLTGFLESRLAPYTTIHGVLVDVYGIGILITGTSGIGKSETALELIKRGHRLVADDAVEIRQPADHVLVGKSPELIRHLLEIRGVGIINVMTLFGAGAVRGVKKISLVVKLEMWAQDRQYERLGLDEETTKIIDTDVTLVTIPVRPGRNLAVIIEVAAMNYRLKNMGYNAALQFTNKLTESLTEELSDVESLDSLS